MINPQKLCLTLLILLGGFMRLSSPAVQAQGVRKLKTVGLYITPPNAEQQHHYDLFKASGYNYLEFADIGFSYRTDELPKYYAELNNSIITAHRKGFKVWILLLAGMKQWKGTTPRGDAGTFSALNKEALEERLHHLREAVSGLPNADGFSFFAGDPGGDPEGRSTVKDCIAFAKKVHQIVEDKAPKAGFSVNLWAIAEWAGFPSPFSLDFWQKQVLLSKAVAEEPSFLGANCGVVFSLDNYYRSLTLSAYADAKLSPPLYPTAKDIQQLRRKGVKPILGWPYFLVDEVDDGFITPNNVVTKGQAQAETRYIRAIIDHGREIGLEGLVANAAFITAEPLNIYAFGRMCHNPRLTPEALLEEYARLLSLKETQKDLENVLRFVENHSNWQNSLPAQYRLKNFDCGEVTTPEVALAKLAQVRPQVKRGFLPEPPADYLKRLKQRLEAIQRGEIGGMAPLVRTKPAPKGER
jgi:hypothetical protein